MARTRFLYPAMSAAFKALALPRSLLSRERPDSVIPRTTTPTLVRPQPRYPRDSRAAHAQVQPPAPAPAAASSRLPTVPSAQTVGLFPVQLALHGDELHVRASSRSLSHSVQADAYLGFLGGTFGEEREAWSWGPRLGQSCPDSPSPDGTADDPHSSPRRPTPVRSTAVPDPLDTIETEVGITQGRALRLLIQRAEQVKAATGSDANLSRSSLASKAGEDVSNFRRIVAEKEQRVINDRRVDALIEWLVEESCLPENEARIWRVAIRAAAATDGAIWGSTGATPAEIARIRESLGRLFRQILTEIAPTASLTPGNRRGRLDSPASPADPIFVRLTIPEGSRAELHIFFGSPRKLPMSHVSFSADKHQPGTLFTVQSGRQELTVALPFVPNQGILVAVHDQGGALGNRCSVAIIHGSCARSYSPPSTGEGSWWTTESKETYVAAPDFARRFEAAGELSETPPNVPRGWYVARLQEALALHFGKSESPLYLQEDESWIALAETRTSRGRVRVAAASLGEKFACLRIFGGNDVSVGDSWTNEVYAHRNVCDMEDTGDAKGDVHKLLELGNLLLGGLDRFDRSAAEAPMPRSIQRGLLRSMRLVQPSPWRARWARMLHRPG